MCNEWKDHTAFDYRSTGAHYGRCKPCDRAFTKEYAIRTNYASQKKYSARIIAEAEHKYMSWKRLATLPYKPMSEKEWLECCSYFGGCATCDEEYIETRQFFMSFQHGGKYAAWNMIPMCEQCSKHSRSIENPFLWLRNSAAMKARGITNERREIIIQWLTNQIIKAGGNTHE